MVAYRYAVTGVEYDLRTKRGATPIDPSTVLDGQVGDAILRVTANGNRAWRRFIQTVPGDDYRTMLLWTPETLDAAAPTPHVAYFHGATANEQQLNKVGNQLLDPWLDLGWSVTSWRLGTTVAVDATQVYPQWVSGAVYQPNDIVEYLGYLYKLDNPGPYSSTKPPGSTGENEWVHDENDGKWGNGPMRDAGPDLLDWINDTLTLPPQGPFFFGTSAGGTNSFSTAVAAKAANIPIAAIYVVDGAFNLAWCYDKNYEQSIPHSPAGASGNIRSQIIAAYNLPGPVRPYSGTPPDQAWIDAVDAGGFDFARVADIGAVLPMVPIGMSAAPLPGGDTLIHKSYNTDVIAAKLAAVPWTEEVELRVTSGNHAISSHFIPSEINAFFARALL